MVFNPITKRNGTLTVDWTLLCNYIGWLFIQKLDLEDQIENELHFNNTKYFSLNSGSSFKFIVSIRTFWLIVICHTRSSGWTSYKMLQHVNGSFSMLIVQRWASKCYLVMNKYMLVMVTFNNRIKMTASTSELRKSNFPLSFFFTHSRLCYIHFSTDNSSQPIGIVAAKRNGQCSTCSQFDIATYC